jgi:TetR/AcrR family transcriptional regulator
MTLEPGVPRRDAHQPQINCHFASKEALWEAAVEHLFSLLTEELADLPSLRETTDPAELGEVVAQILRRFVRFAAHHPELNRIMVQEAAEDSERLHRMVEYHVRPLHEAIVPAWSRLRAAGLAAPIDPASIHWVVVGAASIPFVDAPEVRILAGVEPTDSDWVDAHADGVVATLLPGVNSERSRMSVGVRRSHGTTN